MNNQRTPERPSPDNPTIKDVFCMVLRLPWSGWAVCCLGAFVLFHGCADMGPALGWRPIETLFRSAAGIMILPLLCCLGWSMLAGILRRSADRAVLRPWWRWGGMLAVAGMGLIFLSMMIPAVHVARQAANRGPDQAWTDHVMPAGRFVISTPATWEEQPETAVPGVLNLTTGRQDLFLVAYSVPRVDIVPETLPEFRTLTLQQLVESIGGTIVDESPIQSAGSLSTIDTIATATIDGTRLTFLIRHFDDGTHWGEVRFWTTPSQFAAQAETVDRVLSSLRLAE